LILIIWFTTLVWFILLDKHSSFAFLSEIKFKQAYASILYLRVPDNFRIILRGQDVEPHNVVNDLMYRECVLYKPQIAGQTEVCVTEISEACFPFLPI
jgi:hypothetical protein